MLVEAFKRGTLPPEREVTQPESMPALRDLAKSASGKMQRSVGV